MERQGFYHSLKEHCVKLKSLKYNQAKSFLEKEGIEKTAERLQTTALTSQIILDGPSQPESFDFQTDFDKLNFERSIVCLKDWRLGTILTGRVEKATLEFLWI